MSKVLVIGSGPIVIGQAAEFDYAGTQACKSLKEEGHEVVLINSNPATIMTDPGVADCLYIEPLTPEFCERVIARERPDALLPTLGGQTGLNLATQLADQGILEKYEVKLLGTPLSAIRKAEDRELFRALMREIREPVPESFIIESEEDLKRILPTQVPDEHGRLIEFPYPRIVRPAYTLGGTGGGIANNADELWDIGRKGLKLSMRSQVMIERSLLGWKEVEYEVMRDSAGNCITVCNMENFDPMGVHTGDSIVIAPSQTLSDIEYHMLRTASLKIIQALGIEGGCNVQLAVNPESFDYYVIEVNPRVSRSSALASKATGYPIARVAAKIAVGKTLDQIENQVTKTTRACFEPALDYVVVKIPRWPFDKFASGDRSLFTQMKATGEVMAIDRTFESAFLKAIRGLEVKQKDLWHEGFAGPRSAAVSAARTEGVSPSESEPELVIRQGRKLPHWTRDRSVYHVVFRQGDSVPKEVANSWRNERELLQKQLDSGNINERDYFRLLDLGSERIETLLDAGKGSCLLKDPVNGQIVEDALKFFDGERYELHAWCVMPNHVHAILRPIHGHELSQILHSWKSYTSHQIGKSSGESTSIWESEYYDHIIKSNSEYNRSIAYVLENPGKGKLENWKWVGKNSRWIRGEDEELSGRDAQTTRGRDARVTNGQDARATDEDLRLAIKNPTDERLWAICEGLRRGWGVDEVNRICRVDKWFLNKLQKLIDLETELRSMAGGLEDGASPEEIVPRALTAGFSPSAIENIVGVDDEFKADVKQLNDSIKGLMSGIEKEAVLASAATGRMESVEEAMASFADRVEASSQAKAGYDTFWGKYDSSDPAFLARFGTCVCLSRLGRSRVFKMVDTCAGEFESRTPYFYGAYEDEDDAVPAAERGLA